MFINYTTVSLCLSNLFLGYNWASRPWPSYPQAEAWGNRRKFGKVRCNFRRVSSKNLDTKVILTILFLVYFRDIGAWINLLIQRSGAAINYRPGKISDYRLFSETSSNCIPGKCRVLESWINCLIRRAKIPKTRHTTKVRGERNVQVPQYPRQILEGRGNVYERAHGNADALSSAAMYTRVHR